MALRCIGGTFAAYVIWPQVLSLDETKELTNAPQTLVVWRVDNAGIAVNFWDISSEGTAAGKFTTGGAMKILRPLTGARRLVVQMTGRTKQDAVFQRATPSLDPSRKEELGASQGRAA